MLTCNEECDRRAGSNEGAAGLSTSFSTTISSMVNSNTITTAGVLVLGGDGDTGDDSWILTTDVVGDLTGEDGRNLSGDKGGVLSGEDGW